MGRLNAAAKISAPLYCGKACAGLARRRKIPLTVEQRKEAKAEYDKDRRKRLSDEIKEHKRGYYIANHERILAQMTVARKKRMPKHVEYCRQPKYKVYKREYDRAFRAKKMFGPFADAFLVLQDIEQEVAARMTKYEIYATNGTLNKALVRRRNLLCPKP